MALRKHWSVNQRKVILPPQAAWLDIDSQLKDKGYTKH
ncbi:hypothetical protein BDE27_3757 [Xenorhabdus ehlersii]|uniref:Uncharacterized protein n=1 Tax=Xenorhabdus ehlersii TaxID=290111 RepID=A0A2D0IZD0_9GAMM|nr:hypothetical protein [Xenorhabdus sp. TS4]PHM27273.1 hypothetical protein Xehl_00268 [Xenorhabdus ehlersii]RKE87411.1 hypothetical protein BDE27_3757 [Xenorhabdus ehlersii]